MADPNQSEVKPMAIIIRLSDEVHLEIIKNAAAQQMSPEQWVEGIIRDHLETGP